MRRVELLASHVSAVPVDTTMAQSPRQNPAYLYQAVLKKACEEANGVVAVYWVHDKWTDSLRLAGYHHAGGHSVGDQVALDVRYNEDPQQFEVSSGFGAIGR